MAVTWPNLYFLKIPSIKSRPSCGIFRLAGKLYKPQKYDNDGLDVSDDEDII